MFLCPDWLLEQAENQPWDPAVRPLHVSFLQRTHPLPGRAAGELTAPHNTGARLEPREHPPSPPPITSARPGPAPRSTKQPRRPRPSGRPPPPTPAAACCARQAGVHDLIPFIPCRVQINLPPPPPLQLKVVRSS